MAFFFFFFFFYNEASFLLPFCDKSYNEVGMVVYMLWFKFFGGLKFFEPVSFLFSFVSDYGNEFDTQKIKMKLVQKF